MKKLSVFSLPSWVTCSSSPTSSPSASLHSSIASWPEMGLLTACISGSCTAKLYRKDGQWCDFYTLAATAAWAIVVQYQLNSVKMLTRQAQVSLACKRYFTHAAIAAYLEKISSLTVLPVFVGPTVATASTDWQPGCSAWKWIQNKSKQKLVSL